MSAFLSFLCTALANKMARAARKDKVAKQQPGILFIFFVFFFQVLTANKVEKKKWTKYDVISLLQ